MFQGRWDYESRKWPSVIHVLNLRQNLRSPNLATAYTTPIEWIPKPSCSIQRAAAQPIRVPSEKKPSYQFFPRQTTNRETSSARNDRADARDRFTDTSEPCSRTFSERPRQNSYIPYRFSAHLYSAFPHVATFRNDEKLRSQNITANSRTQ